MRRWSAVFLDRDGTLNVKPPEGQYVLSPDGLVLLPGAAEAVRRLRRAGLSVYVVTNQRGVATGRLSAAALHAVHGRLTALLAAEGTGVDGLYACLHDRDSCACRKPLPGLLQQAAAAHPGLDLSRAVMVGDAASDVAAGAAVGATTVRLAATADHLATVTVRSLREAADWLLG